MPIKQSQSPYGYKYLLVYKKAEGLLAATSQLIECFPGGKILTALADQMIRSARSVKQNIIEGWKRNMTWEYYQFLGYAIASNAELEEDCNDIWKGIYPDLMGIKGVMGNERGETGDGAVLSSLLPPLSPLSHLPPFDIEKLRFYPLDPQLPPVVQLKLCAKELNFLLDRLQGSLTEKMSTEGTLSAIDKLKRMEEKRKENEMWFKNFLDMQGLVQLENGRVVKK